MNGESIFLALGELEEDLVREAARPPRRAVRPRRLLLIAAAAALLTALLATAAGAFGKGYVSRYRTARGDVIVVRTEGGREFHTSGEETCFVRDGRIYIVLDGAEKDITKKCGEKKYYSWEHTYEDGTRFLILAGGTPESMGYLWVYFFPEDGRFGPRATFMLPCFYDYANAPWVAKAEKDYGLEFLGLTAVPDRGDLAVPTVAELIEHGYPVNARGETYGPGGIYTQWLGQPDLELAVGKNGVEGYIRYSESEEVSGGNVQNPEEAIAWMEYVKQRGPVEIPVYKEDGETIVDWFVISPGRAAEG